MISNTISASNIHYGANPKSHPVWMVPVIVLGVALVCLGIGVSLAPWQMTGAGPMDIAGWVALIASGIGLTTAGLLAGKLIERRAILNQLLGSIQGEHQPQFVTAPDLGVIGANGAMSELLVPGGTAEGDAGPATAQDIAERLGPSAGALELSRLLRSAADGVRDRAEIDLSVSLGHRSWWRVTVGGAPGLKGYAHWLFEDITATKAAESAQKKEESYVSDLLNQLPVGMFSVNASGSLAYVNQTLRQWLDLPAIAADDEHLLFADFVAAEADAESNETDSSGMHGAVKLRSANGTEFSAYLIQSEQSGTGNEFAYSRSIVLRDPFLPILDDGSGGALVKRIPWLFSEAPVGIVLLDLYGNIVDCNRSFLKMLGLHRDGVLTRPFSERINKEDRDDTAAQLSKIVMGTLRASMLDVRMPAGGERELAATLYVSRVQDSEGEVSGLVLHVIDTTEQKNLEVQFNQSQKMQAVGQLAGGVAHDFNNLLTAMIGFCDLLLARHGAEDPSFADIMQIKQNANRAANLVRQLLAFSRRQTLQPKIFDVKEALSDLSNLLRRLLGENIDLQISHGHDVDLIRTDPGQFDQVVINLAVNARDAMPGGGQITLETVRVSLTEAVQRGHEVMPAGEYVLMNVADTGSGISKEDIGHIFEPFFSTKGVGEGTGLGLSTVYGIIRQSDGYVFVDSAIGEGTSFSIYLPAYSAADAAAAGEPVLSGLHASEPLSTEDLTGGGTVLLVEDEDAVRVFGSRALRNKGYRVLEASDGEQALDVLNDFDETVHLIITDVMMPGMDGHTLVRLIKEEMPEIKVILMSGYTEEAIPGNIGADTGIHFLPKPFSLQELAGKVKDVIAG